MEGEQNNVNMGVGERVGGGSSGPIIGAIVILVVAILGGLYFWSQYAHKFILFYLLTECCLCRPQVSALVDS